MGKVLVHEFLMGDNEDPEIYAGSYIYDWQQTESGRWVMAHSSPEPHWLIGFSVNTYSYKVQIIAELKEEDQTFFQLKYGNQRKQRL